MNLAKPEGPLEIAICAGEVMPSNRKLAVLRHGAAFNVHRGGFVLWRTRKRPCDSHVGLFADENKKTSTQRYDVKKKDRWPEIQAEA